MKKIVLLTVGMLAFALVSAHAQNTIFYTTDNDWTNWNSSGSLTFQDTNAFDYDGVTANGIGNANPGATSVGGALQVSPIVPCNWGQAGPVFGGPGPTTAILVAMDGPGAAYGSPLAAQSGTLIVDYTMPDHTLGGTYFNMGIFFQDNVQWGGWSVSQNTDLGPVTTPYGTQEMYEATIPYTLNANANLTFAQLGFWIFTDYQGVNPWYVDNISVVPLTAPPTLPPVTPLFVTSNDFALFTSAGGDLIQATNDWDSDNNPTNGLGNTTDAGDPAGTSGSLLLYWSSVEAGWGAIAVGLNEDGNAAFMQAIDPGCDPGSQTSVAAYGNIYIDYSVPDNSGGGSYFSLGVNFSYDANGYNGYSPFWVSSSTDLHVQDNSGYEVYQGTIPYTIQAGHYYGFTPSIYVNSDYQPTNGFHIDNITVSAAQLPLITSFSVNGTNMVIQGTNALGGKNFTLLTSTNLSLPLTNWPAAGAGVFSGPMTFSNSFTINPANANSFYSIKVTP